LRSAIRALHRAHPPEAREEAFEIAQWALQSTAADALSQMAARFGQGTGLLAGLVRERQDLLLRRGIEDERFFSAVGRADAPTAEGTRSTLRKIDAQLDVIDKTLASKFGDYSTLAAPKPLTISETQALLRANEALLLFINVPAMGALEEENYVFVVTKDQSHWLPLSVRMRDVSFAVSALRCGLDEDEWEAATSAANCARRLSRTDKPEESQPLPFDLGIAHDLYLALIAPIKDLIGGKRLLIVPSGALTSLPFHVLVTRKPDVDQPQRYEDYRRVPWLVRDHGVAVLPSVASLKATREQIGTSGPTQHDYIGIGDPVLKGVGRACSSSRVPDQCPAVDRAEKNRVALSARAIFHRHGRRRSGDLKEVFAKGADAFAVVEQVRALCPLPETAYELKCIAERFQKDRRTLLLGSFASEAELRQLSADGKLARYRIVHFATHGLVAGDVEEIARQRGEPALVLTPPDRPRNAEDDGLLTASEISQLRFNADWDVLSACNTAASDGIGAEALSGLARSFFYAGSRALLVSHAGKSSDAAVRLTARFF
jgi:CHAT domain-containing protein